LFNKPSATPQTSHLSNAAQDSRQRGACWADGPELSSQIDLGQNQLEIMNDWIVVEYKIIVSVNR